MSNISKELQRRINSYIEKHASTADNKSASDFFAVIENLRKNGRLCVTTLLKAIPKESENTKQIFKKRIGFAVGSESADLVRSLFAELGIDISRAEMTAIINRGMDQTNRQIILSKLDHYLKDFEYDTQRLLHLESEITELYLSSETLQEEKKYSEKKINSERPVSRLMQRIQVILSEGNEEKFSNVLISIAKDYPNYLPIFFENLHQLADAKLQKALINFLHKKHSPENISASKVVMDALFSSNLATRVVAEEPKFFFNIVPTMQAKVYQRLSPETKKSINELFEKINKKGLHEDIQQSLEIRKAINSIDQYLKNDPNINMAKKTFFEGLKGVLITPNLDINKYKTYLETKPLRATRASRAGQCFTEVNALVNSAFIPHNRRLVKIIARTVAKLRGKKEYARFRKALIELKDKICCTSGESFTHKELFNFKSSDSVTYSELRDHENILIGKCIKDLELVLTNYTDPTIRLRELFDFNKRVEAEASYQGELLTQALGKEKEDIIYSPTGVAIINLTKPESNELKRDQLLEVKFSGKIPDSRADIIEARIAVNISKEFEDKYKNALSEKYGEFKTLTNSMVQSELWKKRNELNPLHDEVIKYTQRIFQVLNKVKKPVLDPDPIQKKIISEINLLVWKEYDKILDAHLGRSLTPPIQINPKQLNIELDEARRKLTQDSLKILVDEYAKENSDFKSSDNLLSILSSADSVRLNHILEETPSTTNDEFFIDPENNLATRLTRTGNTAHGKKEGADKQAQRYIWTTQLTDKNEILPIPGRAPELRVPSIHAGKYDNPEYLTQVHVYKTGSEQYYAESEAEIDLAKKAKEIDQETPTIFSVLRRDKEQYFSYYFAHKGKLLGHTGALVSVTLPTKEVQQYKNNLETKGSIWNRFHRVDQKNTNEKELCLYITKKAGKRLQKMYALEDDVWKLKELFDNFPGGEPRTYHLLTSFPIIYNKKERLHADSILRSAHIYNKNKLHSNDHRFVYVQSIPVNNSGLRLSSSINKMLYPSVAEAALMAEMAVLNSLRQTLAPISSLNKDISALYDDAEKLYRQFLNNNPQGEVYFHKSPEGKTVMKLLQEFRNGPAGELSSKELTAAPLAVNRKGLGIQQLVEHAVKVMFVHNKHLDLAYGRLIQAMTCFLDMCALGCKSANERYGMISGREKVFLGIMLKEKENKEYSKEERAILAALRGLSNLKFISNSLDIGLDALISPLASAYSAHHAAGISNASTLTDQGPSKIIPISILLQGIHTNYTEDPEVNLCADDASKIQPHKGDVFGTLKRMANKKISPVAPKSSPPGSEVKTSTSAVAPKSFSPGSEVKTSTSAVAPKSFSPGSEVKTSTSAVAPKSFSPGSEVKTSTSAVASQPSSPGSKVKNSSSELPKLSASPVILMSRKKPVPEKEVSLCSGPWWNQSR